MRSNLLVEVQYIKYIPTVLTIVMFFFFRPTVVIIIIIIIINQPANPNNFPHKECKALAKDGRKCFAELPLFL